MNVFVVHNHLLKPIKLEFVGEKGVVTLLEILASGKSDIISHKNIKRYFNKGYVLSIKIICDGNIIPFSSVLINEKVTNLHVGMVTSKWVGAESDYNTSSPGLNAVQGLPWVRIHNLTDTLISLNENISIPPDNILFYKGEDHFGVRLGTVFRNYDGIFPNFIFSVPATDIYYGVTTDTNQDEFMGFQFNKKFKNSPIEPHYLLEEGWMGGPAVGNIKPGYLPVSGPKIDKRDRWGNILH